MLEETIQLHHAGRLEEAEQGYRRLLAEAPDNAEVLHLLGILRGQRGDLAEALQLVRRACARAPEDATCQFTLGEMSFREGDLAAAHAAYDAARMLNPNLAAAHAGLGRVALRRGDLATAESHFKVALRADENDAQALSGLGHIAQLQGDPARASQLLTQAAEQAPADPEIQTRYAQAMAAQGMHDFAARALDNALAARPDYPAALALRAELHLLKGEVAQALPIYQSLLARAEEVGPAHAGLGDIARMGGHYDAAIAEYDAALRVRPDLHPAALRRADALVQSGRVAQAIADLRRHLAAHPDGHDVYAALAGLLARTGRQDEALAVWVDATARWPADIDLQAQQALALDAAGRTPEALALADRAAASRLPALALLRARGALLAGDPAAAVQRLQRIEWPAGAPPQLQRRSQRLLGLACDALEQWPDAVQAFTAAFRHDVALPALPALEETLVATLRKLAAAPGLAPGAEPPPVLLCGLPGSGVRQVAELLGDQPGWHVRRERVIATPDFLGGPVRPELLDPLDAAALGRLARSYRRPLKHLRLPPDTRVIDWLPALDVRAVPALVRALPGVRMLLVQREPAAALLNWLGFGWLRGFALADPVTGARWLRVAATHLTVAATLLPTLALDPDALLAPASSERRAHLASFLGVGACVVGPRTQAVWQHAHGGLPTAFPTGHTARYREVLAEAFAVLDPTA